MSVEAAEEVARFDTSLRGTGSVVMGGGASGECKRVWHAKVKTLEMELPRRLHVPIHATSRSYVTIGVTNT